MDSHPQHSNTDTPIQQTYVEDESDEMPPAPPQQQDGAASPGDIDQSNPQKALKLCLQRSIQSLDHACHCQDADCRLPSCQKTKRVVWHTRICKRKTNGSCSVCKQTITLCCFHAKYCQETKCLVPFCSNIKYKLKQQQLQQRVQQAQLLRRRMAVMNTTRTAPGMPPSNVLQVVKHVQEEAARQQVPHYGKAAQQMPPPQQHMQQRHPLHPMEQWGAQLYPDKPQQTLRPPHSMTPTLNHPQLSQMHPHTQHPQHPSHSQQQILNQQNNQQQMMGMVTQQQPGQTMDQVGNMSTMVGGAVRAAVAGVDSTGATPGLHQEALHQLMFTLRSIEINKSHHD